MTNIRALRARIKSVESTRQITSSMKMVSTSKLRRAQNAMSSLRPYSEACSTILSRLSIKSDNSNVFLNPREIKKTCFVIFVGNRGLCGMYNMSLLHYAALLIKSCDHDCFAVLCGRWGKDRTAELGTEPVRIFDSIPESPSASDLVELTDYLKKLYIDAEADEVVLVHQKFISVLSQQPTSRVLLPVCADKECTKDFEYIFEPSCKSIVNNLCDMYISSMVFSTMLEAKSGENAARLTAMTAATDNTDELVAQLSLQLNHARQAAITTEISEIIGGAAALSDN